MHKEVSSRSKPLNWNKNGSQTSTKGQKISEDTLI